MAAKVIVSYDGTDNDRDALALGRCCSTPAPRWQLAYVRHSRSTQPDRETLAQSDAEALLAEGANSLGHPDLPRHVVLNASTGEGLSALAVDEGADVVVFGSEYRTPAGHLQPRDVGAADARGRPGGGGDRPGRDARARATTRSRRVRAIGEVGDRSADETARSLAERLGAELAPRADAEVDLLVVGSQPLAAPGRVAVTSAAQYVLETARSPVLVLPRGTTLRF